MARLEYYIMERILRGTVGGKPVHFFALSGGGGGRRGKPFPTDIVNNPYFESRQYIESKGQDGGPIPPGWYWIRHSDAKDFPKHGVCVRLQPMKHTFVMGRGGFLIHGRGRFGSEGCIVPMIDSRELGKFIDALDVEGGGTLYVDESIEGYRFA
jgi:hypothetical protein